jgi:hypothetical protein
MSCDREPGARSSCSAGCGSGGITSLGSGISDKALGNCLLSAFAKLCDVRKGRIKISAAAEANYLADVALAANFNDLLARAQAAEQAYRHAQATRAAGGTQYQLAQDLDVALTDVTRAAYAAQRAEVGPAGYEDRIYFRKAKATTAVRRWTAEADRLLTLRETHRLTGFPARPGAAAIGAEIAQLPAGDHV